MGVVRLGFDPAVSLHFHVFEFQLDWAEIEDESGDSPENDDKDGLVLGVAIYSSEKRAWSLEQSGWSFEVILSNDYKSVFVNSMLYVVATEFMIGVVDVEGKTWRIIEFPSSEDSPFLDTTPGYIDISQGQLHFITSDVNTGEKLAIWVLEDRESEEWTLKHTVSFNHLVRSSMSSLDIMSTLLLLSIQIGISYSSSLVMKTLKSYDMDSGNVSTICNIVRNCSEDYCISYVPLFSESLADGQQ